jgi:hypothetical protein
MPTPLDEVFEFLRIANDKGFLNSFTIQSRITGCNKLFAILDDDQKNVEYVDENIDLIKTRFSNLHKDVRGNTVDQYAQRVRLVINDFLAWKQDRSAWERAVSAKQTDRQVSAKDKPSSKDKPKKKEAPTERQEECSATINGAANNKAGNTYSFPIRKDFSLSITLPPDGVTLSELKRLGLFLLPYISDWEEKTDPNGLFFPLVKPQSENFDR